MGWKWSFDVICMFSTATKSDAGASPKIAPATKSNTPLPSAALLWAAPLYMGYLASTSLDSTLFFSTLLYSFLLYSTLLYTELLVLLYSELFYLWLTHCKSFHSQHILQHIWHVWRMKPRYVNDETCRFTYLPAKAVSGRLRPKNWASQHLQNQIRRWHPDMLIFWRKSKAWNTCTLPCS